MNDEEKLWFKNEEEDFLKLILFKMDSLNR
jgi:hypothetical protein